MGGFTHESTHNESQEWYTPRSVFDALAVQFDLDVASPGKDIVDWVPAKRHMTIVDDGLLSAWQGNVWMNPPYGQDTPRWFARFAGHPTGIALVFARTDTMWFHKYICLCDGLLFIKGRLKFVKPNGVSSGTSGAPSMLVARGKDNCLALQRSKLGFYCDIIQS